MTHRATIYEFLSFVVVTASLGVASAVLGMAVAQGRHLVARVTVGIAACLAAAFMVLLWRILMDPGREVPREEPCCPRATPQTADESDD